ncbi:hypothetical protein EDD18DRAFT_1359845 [Armillaria luteobubalina]|uniref:Uncharacterized protein n=1 Tax=Armillaria luteobubalina TaxID=153913 RepID=A0AA39ULP5_9AGAR|nr:hypothetical protein EDD18DRAFT_1359845 [Armillaria luteobubalina]
MPVLKGGSGRAAAGTRGRPNHLQTLCTKLSNDLPPGDNALSAEASKSFIAISQGLLHHFEQSRHKSSTLELRNVWTGVAPWSLRIFDHYIISCREDIHHHSFDHAPLVFYILRLLEVLSTETPVCGDMARTPYFISKFAKAWMCLVPATPYRLPATTVIKRIVPLNENAFISSIDSYADQLPLSALNSLGEEFSLKDHHTDYTQLHCVIFCVRQIVRGSRKDSIFCTTRAAIWLLKIVCRLSRKRFSQKRMACNLAIKNKCDGVLRCLDEGFGFFANLVGRMEYTIIAQVLRFGLLKAILRSETLFNDLSGFPQVQEAHGKCRRSWKTFFTKLGGSIPWPPVLRQFHRQLQRTSGVDRATLEAICPDQWLPLVDVTETYFSLYEQRRAKRVCNLKALWLAANAKIRSIVQSTARDWTIAAGTRGIAIKNMNVTTVLLHVSRSRTNKYPPAFASERIKAKHLDFTEFIVGCESRVQMAKIITGRREFARNAGVAVRDVVTIFDFTDGLTELTFRLLRADEQDCVVDGKALADVTMLGGVYGPVECLISYWN